VSQEGGVVPFLTLQPGNQRLLTNAGAKPAILLLAAVGPVS
jgi:hypothetical protein